MAGFPDKLALEEHQARRPSLALGQAVAPISESCGLFADLSPRQSQVDAQDLSQTLATPPHQQ